MFLKNIIMIEIEFSIKRRIMNKNNEENIKIKFLNFQIINMIVKVY